MCYSGNCLFEVSSGPCAGDCTVHWHLFKSVTGFSPCICGGSFDCPEDERFYEEHFDEIQEALRVWWEYAGVGRVL